MKRLRIRDFVCTLAAAVVFASMATHAPRAQELEKVTLAYPPIGDLLPAYVAKDQGIFEKNGLDVTLTSVANLGVVTSSLVAGSADIGFSVALTTMQARDAGIDQVVVAGATKLPLPEGFGGILARTDSGIQSADDLAGKRVAVAGLRAFHHLVLVEWLNSKGVDASKVNFVEVPFPQQADVLRSGQVDAVVTVDPIYARVINENIGYFFEDYLAVVSPDTAVDFYVATRDWAENNAEVLEKFRQSLKEGEAFIAANEASARESLQRWTKLPEAIAQIAKIPPFTLEVSPDQMDFWFELADRQNLLKTDFTSSDMFLE